MLSREERKQGSNAIRIAVATNTLHVSGIVSSLDTIAV